MKEHARGMIFAAFAADALALGVHWIYDTNLIAQKFGRVTKFLKPSPPTYHPTRERGEFTHYGDQTMALLRSISECGRFDRDHFSRSWRMLFQDYTGYLDGATKQTLKNIEDGMPASEAGSGSQDLAGAARIAPLMYCYRDNLPRLLESSRQQTALTHNNPDVVDSAEFFSKAAWQVLQGMHPKEALNSAAGEAHPRTAISEWVRAGIASISEDTCRAVGRFGQMCETASAFPATVHLIAKYEESLEDGLIENVMAGGDSAGRGLLVGLVLGAYNGESAIPETWITDLKARSHIDRLLTQIDSSRTETE